MDYSLMLYRIIDYYLYNDMKFISLDYMFIINIEFVGLKM